MTFSDLVEEVRQRPVSEKREIEHLLRRDLIEERRKEMFENHVRAVEEVRTGKRVPTSNVAEFMRRLDAQ